MGEFKNRLIKAMEIRNISQAELAKQTGLSKPRISQYVNGVYEAKQDALLKLSKALMVDVAWLMGYDVPMNSALDRLAKKQVEEEKLLGYFRQLNNEGKIQALAMLKSLSEMEPFREKNGESSKKIDTA